MEHGLGMRALPSHLDLYIKGCEIVPYVEAPLLIPHILLGHLFSAEAWRKLLGHRGQRSGPGFAC